MEYSSIIENNSRPEVDKGWEDFYKGIKFAFLFDHLLFRKDTK